MENNQFSADNLDLLWVIINPTQLIGGGKDKAVAWRGASSQAEVWERRMSHSWLSKDFLPPNTALFDLLAKECRTRKWEQTWSVISLGAKPKNPRHKMRHILLRTSRRVAAKPTCPDIQVGIFQTVPYNCFVSHIIVAFESYGKGDTLG